MLKKRVEVWWEADETHCVCSPQRCTTEWLLEGNTEDKKSPDRRENNCVVLCLHGRGTREGLVFMYECTWTCSGPNKHSCPGSLKVSLSGPGSCGWIRCSCPRPCSRSSCHRWRPPAAQTPASRWCCPWHWLQRTGNLRRQHIFLQINITSRCFRVSIVERDSVYLNPLLTAGHPLWVWVCRLPCHTYSRPGSPERCPTSTF